MLSVDTDSASLTPLLSVVGAAFALGAPVDTEALFAGRVVRPLPLDGTFTFLASPCEAAPDLAVGITESVRRPRRPRRHRPSRPRRPTTTAPSTLDLLRQLAAERVELPLETVTAATHPLDDLHLSSITVGQLVNDVTRRLDRAHAGGDDELRDRDARRARGADRRAGRDRGAAANAGGPARWPVSGSGSGRSRSTTCPPGRRG